LINEEKGSESQYQLTINQGRFYCAQK